MKIDIPCEIGDPVVKVMHQPNRDPSKIYKAFEYTDIPDFGKTVFRTNAEADRAIKKITNPELFESQYD